VGAQAADEARRPDADLQVGHDLKNQVETFLMLQSAYIEV
jgi:hypothetical protein